MTLTPFGPVFFDGRLRYREQMEGKGEKYWGKNIGWRVKAFPSCILRSQELRKL
jgi:hypothetical protein